MDKQKDNKRIAGSVTAVVPAYNEAPRIGEVLRVLTAYPGFKEIIVIDDGSLDGTAAVAEKWNVRVVRNASNMGKGYAMDRGVALAQSEIIFFSDADISGLTHSIIDEVLEPVLSGKADMFIGMSDRQWYFAHQVLTFIPLLGGERAITKNLWAKLPDYYKQHFRVEVALNFYAIYYGKGFQYKILNGVSQTIKEEKYGFLEGVRGRLRMIYNIFSAQLKLNFFHIPKFAKNGRWLALLSLYGAAGIVLGTLIFAALYFGPSEFVRYIFAEDLRDPTASLAPFLLNLSNLMALDTIALVGLLIFTSSVIIFMLTWKNLSFLLYSFIHKLRNGRKRDRA